MEEEVSTGLFCKHVSLILSNISYVSQPSIHHSLSYNICMSYSPGRKERAGGGRNWVAGRAMVMESGGSQEDGMGGKNREGAPGIYGGAGMSGGWEDGAN